MRERCLVSKSIETQGRRGVRTDGAVDVRTPQRSGETRKRSRRATKRRECFAFYHSHLKIRQNITGPDKRRLQQRRERRSAGGGGTVRRTAKSDSHRSDSWGASGDKIRRGHYTRPARFERDWRQTVKRETKKQTEAQLAKAVSEQEDARARRITEKHPVEATVRVRHGSRVHRTTHEEITVRVYEKSEKRTAVPREEPRSLDVHQLKQIKSRASGRLSGQKLVPTDVLVFKAVQQVACCAVLCAPAPLLPSPMRRL